MPETDHVLSCPNCHQIILQDEEDDSETQFFFFYYEFTVGEHSIPTGRVFKVPKDKTPEEAIHAHLSNMFFHTTYKDGNAYYGYGEEIMVRPQGWRKLSKAEFEIISRVV